MVDFNPANYNDHFIADLVEFVSADTFQSLFENFFLAHATKFSYDEEHRLEYTELYQKFSALFEEQLEVFCQSKNMTQADFVKRCRQTSSNDPKTRKYIDILLSSVEYETFVRLMQLMRPVAEERHRILHQADPKSNHDHTGNTNDNMGSSKGLHTKDIDDSSAQPHTTTSTTNDSYLSSSSKEIHVSESKMSERESKTQQK